MATIKTPRFEWGKSDCLIDIFGDEAHQNISWLKETHNETLGWFLTLSDQERWDLMRATAEGQGHIRVDKAEPGDAAIGFFRMGDLDLPNPWFAQMGVDCHYYVRMPWGVRVVDYIGTIEVYRCQRLQSVQ